MATTYALSQQTHDGNVVLRLYNKQTRALVWTRTVKDTDRVSWSKDYHALALAVFVNNGPVSILFWREGQVAPMYCRQAKHWGNYEDDGVINFAWSPDNQRLLFRTWGSGGLDMNVGSLWCLNISTGYLQTISPSVRQMEWVGKRSFRYWTIHPVKDSGGLNTISFAVSVQAKYRTCP